MASLLYLYRAFIRPIIFGVRSITLEDLDTVYLEELRDLYRQHVEMWNLQVDRDRDDPTTRMFSQQNVDEFQKGYDEVVAVLKRRLEGEQKLQEERRLGRQQAEAQRTRERLMMESAAAKKHD